MGIKCSGGVVFKTVSIRLFDAISSFEISRQCCNGDAVTMNNSLKNGWTSFMILLGKYFRNEEYHGFI